MSGHQKLSPDTGWFEPLRSLGHAAVLANYAAVGTAIEHPTRVFILSNFTDRDVVMSIDGIDDYFLKEQSFMQKDIMLALRQLLV